MDNRKKAKGRDNLSKINERRAVTFSEEQIAALDKYAALKGISRCAAVRRLVDDGLSTEANLSHQTEIRGYIRQELETVLPVVMKPYLDRFNNALERLIKMQAVSTRSSSAALMATVSVISELYIDTATSEEILANALRLAAAITKTTPKSDAEYLAEARLWLNADLGRPSDY